MTSGPDPEPHIRMEPGFEDTWPGARALAAECILNLEFLTNQITAFGEALVRRHGIPSRAAFNVLLIVDGAGEPLPPSVIAARMFVTRPTVSGVLGSLERRGLIRRLPHPQDRRMALVAITPQGQARLERFRPALHQAETRWMASLTEAEQRALLRLLAKLQADAPSPEE